MPKNDKRVETGEVMSNVAYSQPHNVQKYRPELGGQVSMVCHSYFFIIDESLFLGFLLEVLLYFKF